MTCFIRIKSAFILNLCSIFKFNASVAFPTDFWPLFGQNAEWTVKVANELTSLGNSGNVTVTLSRTLSMGNGCNLVGNPYSSYLDWTMAATAYTSVSSTA